VSASDLFGDEHALMRRTVRAFVEKEVMPHVDAWEEAGQIPRTFWRRLAELGLLGHELPVEHGGGGGDFLSSVVLGEEMARCRSGGVAFSVLVHTDMSWPWLTRYGTAPRSSATYPASSRARRCAPSASPSPARDRTWPRWRPGRCGGATTTS
jgi:acyl-CoA dehydrogenase